MPAGELLTPGDRAAIERAVRNAESSCGFDFSVYVGASDGDARSHAERLHAQLARPSRAVLVLVDPVARLLEIVTGTEVRLQLDDAEVGLAALSMQTAFAAGDFAGGISTGLQQLADHARRPPMLHTE
ncbi:MAG: TPM domain-containing protein [Actinomycetota bacterium]|nr:TPM domain-containing protein [Actinomycetota bacterium]